MPVEVISLISDEESTIPPPRKRCRTQSSPINLASSTDDEVVIVSHNKRGEKDLTEDPIQPTQTKAEDEIECVGEQRGVDVLADYPHFRFQCAKLAWPTLACRGPKRQRFCPRCFCYVCDIPAAECQKWSSHEHAHDGTAAWRSKRREKVERRKRVEIGDNPTQQSRSSFVTPFNTQAGSLYSLQPLHSALKRRRKMKSKRNGGGRKRGRAR